MLDYQWWDARYRDNEDTIRMSHERRSWYDLSDVPTHLRFEPREPDWDNYYEKQRRWRRRYREHHPTDKPPRELDLGETDDAIDVALSAGKLQRRPEIDRTLRIRHIMPEQGSER